MKHVHVYHHNYSMNNSENILAPKRKNISVQAAWFVRAKLFIKPSGILLLKHNLVEVWLICRLSRLLQCAFFQSLLHTNPVLDVHNPCTCIVYFLAVNHNMFEFNQDLFLIRIGDMVDIRVWSLLYFKRLIEGFVLVVH